MEGFRQGSSHNSGQQTQSKLGSALHQYEVDLPASYGRRLISEEEMDIINVRISSVVQLSCFEVRMYTKFECTCTLQLVHN